MLKKSGIIFLLLLNIQLGFSQFSDDFTDGDFTINPIWSGDNSFFNATTNELNSQSPSAGSYYLSTPSSLALNAQWDFFFNMQFGTSGVNFIDVYLTSDMADVTTPNDGYFVRIGGTPDEISLYKLVGGVETILIDGPDGVINSTSNNPFDVRVTRDASNNWTLFYDDGAASSLISIGTIMDNSVTTSLFFGLAITQSGAASAVNGHFFDNFSVGPMGGADVSAPQIDSLVVLNANNLDVYFNEPTELTSAQTLSNYSVDLAIGNPSSAVRDVVDSSIVHLTFATAFTNGQNYNLTTTNVTDTLANAITSSVDPFTYFVFITPNYGDVVINEIFADPTPQVGLPTEEFVELYNNTSNLLVLNNWQFVNSTTVKTLPNVSLQPNSFVLLCDINDTALYSPFGDVIGISSFTAMVNGGDSLTLMDDNSNVLDIINYNISWYQDVVKDDGGWTLERINPNHSCSNAANWIASNDVSGGTPGAQNSVFDNTADSQSPQIDSVYVVSLTQLEVFFSETMDSTSLANAAYAISGPSSISGIMVQPNLTEVLLDLTPAIDSLTLYTLIITGGTDCSGNSLNPDSIIFSKGIADTISPQIDSLIVIDGNNLAVYFNETVDLATAQNLTNYAVDLGIGNPSAAVRDALDSSLVYLTFSSAFTNGQNYNLTTQNVEDYASNTIVTSINPFIYFLIVAPNFGDVLINEIFADPSPQENLPTEEFVELYNKSTNTFVLNNWKFVNSTTIKTIPNYTIAPNSYVILCDLNDTALYSPYGNVIGISSFSALTNGSDSLTLMHDNNNVLDIVSYDISWYQDNVKDDGGWTLERINPDHPCSNAENWIASANPNGGTPGTQNSVFDNTPDIQSPLIVSAIPSSTTQISILFNETMDSTSLANAVFNLSDGVTVASFVVFSNLQGGVLTTGTPLDSSIVYTLTIVGANDCSGNILNPNTMDFGIGAKPSKYEIVINELFADPSPTNGLPTEDYLEIYNNTSKILDLTNCWISDLTSMDQISAGKILPGEYLIICDNSFENQFTPFGKVIAVTSFPSLNNSEDVITLFTEDTTLIHSVHYFDSWYRDDNKKDGGWSLEMIDPNNPCGKADNWIASTKWFGGTPGTENTAFGTNPDVVLPMLTEANVTNDSTVVITFSEAIDNEGLMAAIYAIDNGIIISVIQIIDSKNVQLNLSTKLTFQIKYTITVTGAFDCVGNIIGSNNTAIFALPEQGFAGDLIINEVLFNPFAGSEDFVEVYNNSNKFINLQDWSLANLENDSIDNYKTLIDQPKLILPGEFVLLTKNNQGVENDYLNAISSTFLQMETLPTYSNDAGDVYLINNLNMVVDEFHYEDDMHFALLNSEDGVSLERIDYDRPSSDETNWHSAAEAVGFATPGYENSQYLKTDNDGGDLVISPETFSPDNDGLDDVVNISYNFASEGSVANIIIYDAKGRLIKNLVKNELLGVSGTFSWDGINESNEKARIGIYIIFAEIFDVDGNVKSYKKTTVLAGRFN